MKRIAEFQPEHEHEGSTDYIEVLDYPTPYAQVISIFYSPSINNFLYVVKTQDGRDHVQKVNSDFVIQETERVPDGLKISISLLHSFISNTL